MVFSILWASVFYATQKTVKAQFAFRSCTLVNMSRLPLFYTCSAVSWFLLFYLSRPQRLASAPSRVQKGVRDMLAKGIASEHDLDGRVTSAILQVGASPAVVLSRCISLKMSREIFTCISQHCRLRYYSSTFWISAVGLL